MKKFLVMLFVLMLAVSTANAEEKAVQNDNPQPQIQHKHHKDRIKRESAFEQKLGLTEEQKVQARELRKQNFEKIKPVIDEIRAKHEEANAIKNSRIAIPDQAEKLNKIDKDLKALEKQASEIRKENMKEFEKILDKKQLQTLKEMKKEGRENFKKEHPYGRPPMPPCQFQKTESK